MNFLYVFILYFFSLFSISADSHTHTLSLFPPPLFIVHLSQISGFARVEISGFARFVVVEIGALVVLEIMVVMEETMKGFAWLTLWVCDSYSGF